MKGRKLISVTPVVKALPFASILALVAAPSLASGQDEQFATDDMKKKVMAEEEKTPEDGWAIKAKVGATANINFTDNVVGTDDGWTALLGGVLGATANYREGQHLWENALSLQETFTYTPQLDRFVKSLDQVDLASTYSYRFQNPNWLGLFARASLNTQILNGDYVAENEVTVRRVPTDNTIAAGDLTRIDTIDYADGGSLQVTQGGAFRLTQPFEPLNLRQSIGLFADPVKSVPINLAFKVGLGAQEIITSGGDLVFAEITDAMGNLVVVRALEDFVFELGAEVEVDARGALIEKVLTYYLTLNAFYPPFTTSAVERSFADSINMRLKAGLSAKINKQVSIDYVLTVLRIPAVTTDFQTQMGLLISTSFDVL